MIKLIDTIEALHEYAAPKLPVGYVTISPYDSQLGASIYSSKAYVLLQSLELVALRATALPTLSLPSAQLAEWAGRALQHVLPSLEELTRLHLVDVDCCNVLPWGDRALTNLK